MHNKIGIFVYGIAEKSNKTKESVILESTQVNNNPNLKNVKNNNDF